MIRNEALARQDVRFVMAVAGGGASAAADLLRHGGMSATLLSAHALQDCGAVDHYIGGTPEKYACEGTARRLAVAAYREALGLSGLEQRTFGVGASSSLRRPSGERAGRPHSVHVAVQTSSYTHSHSFVLGCQRTRYQEEELAATLVRRFVDMAAGLWPESNPLPLELCDDASSVLSMAAEGWADLLHERTRRVGPEPSRYVLPSSCNPLHEGHLGMTRWVEENVGFPVDIELCVANADKPPLDYVDIRRRVEAVETSLKHEASFGHLQLTNTGLFSDKAELFPDTTFLVGADTLARVLDTRFYGGPASCRVHQLGKIADAGCRFLVFPRPGCEIDLAALDPWFARVVDVVIAGYTPSTVSSTEKRKAADAHAV